MQCHAAMIGTSRVIVLSNDTDVTVAFLYYWKTVITHGTREFCIGAGLGDKTRYIPVHTLYALVENYTLIHVQSYQQFTH